MQPCPTHFLPEAWRELNDLASEVRDRGADMFVFGSFATGQQCKTSDTDIGVRWVGAPDLLLFAEIADRLDSLPTMRTLDLVDFSAVDPEFAEIALRCIVQLGDDTSFMSPRYAE